MLSSGLTSNATSVVIGVAAAFLVGCGVTTPSPPMLTPAPAELQQTLRSILQPEPGQTVVQLGEPRYLTWGKEFASVDFRRAGPTTRTLHHGGAAVATMVWSGADTMFVWNDTTASVALNRLYLGRSLDGEGLPEHVIEGWVFVGGDRAQAVVQTRDDVHRALSVVADSGLAAPLITLPRVMRHGDVTEVRFVVERLRGMYEVLVTIDSAGYMRVNVRLIALALFAG